MIMGICGSALPVARAKDRIIPQLSEPYA